MFCPSNLLNNYVKVRLNNLRILIVFYNFNNIKLNYIYFNFLYKNDIQFLLVYFIIFIKKFNYTLIFCSKRIELLEINYLFTSVK
jgi:hypothetical protein